MPDAGSAVDNGHELGASGLQGGRTALMANGRSLPSVCISDMWLATEEQEGGAFEIAKRERGLGFARPWAGTLVLANTLLGGAGMLGIPHAFSVAGYGLGLVLVAVFGVLSAFGSHLLQCSAREIGVAPSSFYSVANAVAPRWTWLIDGAVMIKCFGVGTSYLIIVGDLAPDAVRFFGAEGVERWHAITAGFAVAGTLACFRNLSALRYTAVLSMLIVLWTLTLIFLFFVQPGEAFNPCASSAALDAAAQDSELPCNGAAFAAYAAPEPLTLGKVLPVFIFGFTCQQNVFTICNEVRRATRRRVDGIIATAYSFSGLTIAATAYFGYATYGDAVEANVLKGCYPQSSEAVQLTRLCFSLLAVLSYPLQAHPSRNSALALWTIIRGPPGPGHGNEREDPPGGAATTATARRGEARRYMVTTAVGLALSLMTAILVLDLGVILGVVGATGSTMVSYILPGLVYTRAFQGPSLERKLAFGQLLLGCIIMPACLVMLFA